MPRPSPATPATASCQTEICLRLVSAPRPARGSPGCLGPGRGRGPVYASSACIETASAEVTSATHLVGLRDLRRRLVQQKIAVTSTGRRHGHARLSSSGSSRPPLACRASLSSVCTCTRARNVFCSAFLQTTSHRQTPSPPRHTHVMIHRPVAASQSATPANHQPGSRLAATVSHNPTHTLAARAACATHRVPVRGYDEVSRVSTVTQQGVPQSIHNSRHCLSVPKSRVSRFTIHDTRFTIPINNAPWSRTLRVRIFE